MSQPVQLDRTKIRLGLAIISASFLATAFMFAFVDDALGKAVFAAVALLLVVRMFLLFRDLRRERDAATVTAT